MATKAVQGRRRPRPIAAFDLLAPPVAPGTVDPEPSTPGGPASTETGGTPNTLGATPPSNTRRV
ncbi:MAG: hypothetical protein HHJ11_06825 [Phycicoccus sp.]|nr:hypothetical protein [Phycicoccus sp.]